MKNINVRQRTFYSNRNFSKADYRNVFIFQHSLFGEEEPIKISKTREGKEKFTTPAKKILNDKKSKMYFDLLVKGNFDVNDYFISLSYADRFLPESEEEADKVIKKYIRELRKEAKKRGIKNLKYIYVTEAGSKNGRIHHHMILENCLPRDLVEDLWSKQVRPFHPERERIGWANVKRIQVASPSMKGNGPDYMIRISRYMSKRAETQPGKKRWKQSTGLILPGTSKSDGICSLKQFEQMSLFEGTSFEASNPELVKFVKKHHRGFVVTELKREYNEFTGKFYISLQLMRKNVYMRSMSIFGQKELTELEAADRYVPPIIPEYRITGTQGRLW
ncbi:MAG: hypothetical protein IKZ43_07390 [Acidaminococcaceae bacterium]|nr:hypothetical protein [Acidaminococcaceae bacterium]